MITLATLSGWMKRTTLLVVALLFMAFGAKAQTENSIYDVSSTINSVTATYFGRNACVGNNDYSVVKWYRGTTLIAQQTIWLQYNEYFNTTYTFDCTDMAPNSAVNLSVTCDHYYCVWPSAGSYTYSSNGAAYIQQLAAYNPVSGVAAIDGKFGNRVIVTWSDNEQFDNHQYRVYRDGVQIGSDLPAGTTSYTHSGLPAGASGNYTVRGLVNGSLVAAPAGDNGSAFNINLHATNSFTNNIKLTWANFSNTNAAAGFFLKRLDGSDSISVTSESGIYSTAHEDASITLIPGYSYNYVIKTLPLSNNIVGTATGKVLPNGIISGTVKTPTNIGVPNVLVTVTLQGPSLPTDTTAHYSAITNSAGEYTISGIYYYTGATFTVAPQFAGRVFDPATRNVTLDQNSHTAAMVNFTDLSSFTISGTIFQDGCPLPNASMLVDGINTGAITDNNGTYNLTVSSGGNYTIKPELGDHTFNPAQRLITITSNTSGVNFLDTSTRVLDGYFTASCNTYLGVAQFRVYSADTLPNCFSDTLTTDANGYFSAVLPARDIRMDLLSFISFNESVISVATIMGYFANEVAIDLTEIDSTVFHGDTLTYNFTYRNPPELSISGIGNVLTCGDTVYPVMQQRVNYALDISATESFTGISCPAGDGYVVITENISSYGIATKTDTLYYEQGEVLHYNIVPGTPNLYGQHLKNFTAILYCDNLTDTIVYDVIVLGHAPRSQTFTTVTPQIPFHILHNPPGDASYSYLETSTSISNSFTTSFLQEGSLNTFFTAMVGPDQTVSAGIGAEVEMEIDITFDVTGTLGVGVSGLTTDACTVTSTAAERFETSANTDMIGSAGDVYIGGALNMLYALSDALLYDFDSCKLKQKVVLMMQPKGINTTFIYTESHINEVIIPELQYMVDYYTGLNSVDSAAYFQNQLHVWEQIVETSHQNISNDTVANKSFSGGTSYESSIETTRSSSHSIEMNYYLDYGVAVAIGATINGMGIQYGFSVQGRSTWGNVATSETATTTTVGYVLSDDDMGDSYSVDILIDSVYGTPAFRLVAGRSSCPWEEGTSHREGVQLLSNSNYQEAEESDQAVFILEMSNASESNEAITYDLVFDHTSNPNGAVITIGGSPVVGNVPYPYTIPAGGSVYATITVSKGPVASLYNGLKFTLKSSCDDQISQDVYLSAMFYKTHTLTVAQNGQGSTTPGSGVNTYREGTTVYLYASPAPGYVFQKWVIGSQVITDPSLSIVLNTDNTATAYFVETTASQYALVMTETGHGTTVPPVGTHYFNEGSTVNLSAVPDLENAFVKWVINGVEYTNPQPSIVISGSTSVEAIFTETRVLHIEVASGQGSTNPAAGYTIVNDGSQIQLYASPALGYIFNKWVIDGVDYTTQALELNITQDTLVHVYFDTTSLEQFQVIVSNIGNGTSTPPMGVHYITNGSTLSLEAYPESGYLFEKWVIDGVDFTDNPHNITISDATMIDAYFKLNDVGINTTTSQPGNIVIYPNPSGGTLHVSSQENIDRAVVFDLLGKAVFTKETINRRSFEVDLSALPGGSYFIRLFAGNRITTIKLQIMH